MNAIRNALLLALLIAAVAPHAALADDPPPLPTIDEVMKRLDDLYRSDASEAHMRMSIVTANFSRTLEMQSWSKGADHGLVVITSPAKEAGTATLRTDEGLWNYAPRADRLIRVPSGLLSESWMGSHFSNDDLMRESSWADDYTTTVEWKPDGSGWVLVVTSIPHDDTAIVYSRIVATMRSSDFLPVKQEFYDGNDLVRTMTFSDIREIDGKPIPMKMTLTPADDPEESTTVEYLDLKLNASVKDSIFTPRGLRKAAGRAR